MPRLQSFEDSTYSQIYSQKRKDCKGAFQEEVEQETAKQPPVSAKPTKTITNITDDIVNTYIKKTLIP